MQRIPDERCISICGLFCGACPAFPQQCHGCLSDYLRDTCRECKNGFRNCAKKHNVTHCYKCEEFPCDRIEKFSQGPFINGVNNHANIIPDCQRLKEIGEEQWLEEKMKLHTCPLCGGLITWYEMGRHNCRK